MASESKTTVTWQCDGCDETGETTMPVGGRSSGYPPADWGQIRIGINTPDGLQQQDYDLCPSCLEVIRLRADKELRKEAEDKLRQELEELNASDVVVETEGEEVQD